MGGWTEHAANASLLPSADFSARSPAGGPGGDPEWPVELFHRAAGGSVPAYREFLREHGADPAAVRTLDGFARLPLMTKENYHTKYSLAERCRDGRLDSCDMIAVSSGSTGHPTYWPRFVLDELSVATRFEQVFRDSFGADRTGPRWPWSARNCTKYSATKFISRVTIMMSAPRHTLRAAAIVAQAAAHAKLSRTAAGSASTDRKMLCQVVAAQDGSDGSELQLAFPRG